MCAISEDVITHKILNKGILTCIQKTLLPNTYKICVCVCFMCVSMRVYTPLCRYVSGNYTMLAAPP